MSVSNPLLSPFTLQNKCPPFNLIQEDHYLPALEASINAAKKTLATMKTNSAPADFENTILVLETCAEQMGIIAGIFYNQLSAAGTDGLQALADKIGPLSSNFSTDITLDADIFARVKEVWGKRDSLALTVDQQAVLKETYDGFVRGGALLEGASRNKLKSINERLSILGPTFANNVKKSAEAFELILTNENDIEGLPDTARLLAHEDAAAKGHKNAWRITLDIPSYMPFLTYAKNRSLREMLWHAFSRRGFDAPFDNKPLVLEIVNLRAERAKLLGYKNHAAYVLEKRMAQNPDQVFSFLEKMRSAYKPAAEKDFQNLCAFAKKLDGIDELKPWDVAYYSEKLKESLFSFSSEDLRPYFPIDTVLEGTFKHFSMLFGVKFTPSTAYPVWHKDVVTYDVMDEKDNRFLGTFYADFFPRDGKKDGAWQTTYRGQGLYEGRIERPVVAIVCNFTKPSADQPSLLTHDEVKTLFHEMGHAMHTLLAEGAYPSITGTSVLWDFVELPSQVQENWLNEPETLALVSSHVNTKAPIPPELVKKMRAAENFFVGWGGLRQMAFSYMDMVWHTQDHAPDDVCVFEDHTLEGWTFFPRLGGTSSTSFSHIFAGGYSAGYYSYKWAEVLDADTFELFLEAGLYDPQTAQKYRTEILSKGGSEHPSVLYRRFRGRDADPDALLRREGLIKKAA